MWAPAPKRKAAPPEAAPHEAATRASVAPAAPGPAAAMTEAPDGPPPAPPEPPPAEPAAESPPLEDVAEPARTSGDEAAAGLLRMGDKQVPPGTAVRVDLPVARLFTG